MGPGTSGCKGVQVPCLQKFVQKNPLTLGGAGFRAAIKVFLKALQSLGAQIVAAAPTALNENVGYPRSCNRSAQH